MEKTKYAEVKIKIEKNEHTTQAMRSCQRSQPTANSLQANALANLLAHRIANRCMQLGG